MRIRLALTGSCALALLLGASLGRAAGGYRVERWAVAGGGGQSSGGGYSALGTAGQVDAATLGGGGYTVLGGLWNEAPHRTFLPLTSR